ncbi:putative FAD-linked oxidoreductase [archaeon HR01]|nr:putative FAD-linked oxidoreductase [archaeon HR01]
MDIVRDLARIVGDDHVLTDEESLTKYSRDMASFERRPQLVVRPGSVEEISAVMRYCYREGIPVTVWGAGTSLTGAVVTDRVILDVSRLNKIHRIDTVNYYVHVDAGVILEDLNKELMREGFFFPPDPASSFICTVGGAIAEGAGGLRCVKYGTVKDWVLALKVVLPDGSIVKLGEPLAKNRAGYNLTQLFVGSEGTLGVIAEAWLKITPIPDAPVRRLYAHFDSWEEAGNAILDIRRSRIIPRMLEFFDRVGLEAANKLHGTSLEVGEAMLLIDVEEYRGDEAAKVVEILKRNGAKSVRVAASEEEAEMLLQVRATMYLALNLMAPSRLIEDVCVPIDKIVEYLAKIKELSAKYGLVISMNGHAGDGNIHPSILYDAGNPSDVEKVDLVVDELMAYAISLGGTITGEHGVGIQKMRHLVSQLRQHNGEEVLRLMKEIKNVFDPRKVMNPGKYIDIPEELV